MQEIKSLSQFNKLKSSPLLIVDFYAIWCGPCKVISPAFERLSQQHSSNSSTIVFAKCDVDKAQDVAQQCGITAMPTFQFFKSGAKLDEVRGADIQQLTAKISAHTLVALKDFPNGPTNTKPAAAGSASGPESLRGLIDTGASRLLNTSNLSSVRNIATPPPAGYTVASLSGAKLLIHLSFTQVVTPSLLKITIAKDSASAAPSRLQIGTNVPVKITKSPEGVETNDLDMEASLQKAENTQAFNVFSDEYVNGVAELKLKASKFKGVKSLLIRVDANMSGEESTITKIGQLDIVGVKA